ncbi:MAG TPA: hypothetical protein ENJ43_00320 [Gammaproteobacteria bacterium]|nr:hypothetical protein [Gammaproteobacteria bacterium]
MPSAVRKIIFIVYTLALMVFTVWYGYFIYPIIFAHSDSKHAEMVEEKDSGKTEEELMFEKFLREQAKTSTTDLGYMVVKEQYVKGHFHHVGMTIEPDTGNVCIKCHGAVPHDKAKAIRGFLNMHAFFLACEVCHIPPKEGQPKWAFRWYQKSTGNVIANPPGLVTTEIDKYGNYGAKVAPGTLDDSGTFHLLNTQKERDFVDEYLQKKDLLGETEQSKMKKVIHRKVAEQPLLCEKCHTTEGKPYLPFAQLGYPPRRINALTSTEVVGMVKKYRKFYIPKFLLQEEEAKKGKEPGKGENGKEEGGEEKKAVAM